MTTAKTYLIAGATRGIGRGLVASLLLKDNSTVVAGVRDPNASTAKSLEELPKGKGSKVIVVKIDSSRSAFLPSHPISPTYPSSLVLIIVPSDTDAPAAIQTLRTTHSITALDVVIANAGIAQSDFINTADISIAETRQLFEINTLGPIRLFQAMFPLLRPGSRFLVTSSLAGSTVTALNMPFGTGAYGISKAAVNHFVAKGMFVHLCA